ncbi:4529_t:CDS:2, partial [Scutellospora calospora]
MSTHLENSNKTTELEIKTFELENYPTSPMITYKETKNNITQRSFNYFIEAEGFYLNASKLHYTLPPKKHPISDNYSVITSWGRGKNQQTIQCKIVYVNGKPEFQIRFGTFFEHEIKSSISATTAATNYEKAINKTSRLSGSLLFGLQLQILKNIRESRPKQYLPAMPYLIKPSEQYSQSTLDRRAKDIAEMIKKEFVQNSIFTYHKQDSILLKSFEYSVDNHIYHLNFGADDIIQNKNEILNIIKTIDSNYISRDAYRSLAAINYYLPREHNIVTERNNLTYKMTEDIPIKLVDMNMDATDSLEISEGSDNIDVNIDINKVLSSVGTGRQRNCKGILRYLIPYLVHEDILSIADPIIHLRISGDGRNVGRKVKHVMITFMILNDQKHQHMPNYHYTIALYPGIERYESLEIILNPFLNDLRDLKINGLEVEGILWYFELYFSSDWKFLAICLGLNAANSNHFCAWCLCSKQEIGNITQDWRITKSMDDLKNNYLNIPSHIKPPLFEMIPLSNYVFDELHVLLRVEDRLWTLILSEIKERGLFNDISRQIIVNEMKRLNIKFHFWEESNTWKYTSLTGNDKIKVLQYFNLATFFRPSRAKLIQSLWNKFIELYKAIFDKDNDPLYIKYLALEWLKFFLKPDEKDSNNPQNIIKGLYLPIHITPYIHFLIFHRWELYQKHNRWGLKAFSCSAVEKKNHMHVSFFFRKTAMNGGNLLKRNAATIEILEYESRNLFFAYNNLPPLSDLNFQKQTGQETKVDIKFCEE